VLRSRSRTSARCSFTLKNHIHKSYCPSPEMERGSVVSGFFTSTSENSAGLRSRAASGEGSSSSMSRGRAGKRFGGMSMRDLAEEEGEGGVPLAS